MNIKWQDMYRKLICNYLSFTIYKNIYYNFFNINFRGEFFQSVRNITKKPKEITLQLEMFMHYDYRR